MNLMSTSFLLDKLVSRENLNTLVLNLYPGNKGYSLAFRVGMASNATGSHADASGSTGGQVTGGPLGGSSAGKKDVSEIVEFYL